MNPVTQSQRNNQSPTGDGADVAAGHPVPSNTPRSRDTQAAPSNPARAANQDAFLGESLLDLILGREDWSRPIVEPLEPIDLGVGIVDSLTLTNCKVLGMIFDEDEDDDDAGSEDGTMDASACGHSRGGTRRGRRDEVRDFTVETKNVDG